MNRFWKFIAAAVAKSGEPELYIYGDIVDDGWYPSDVEAAAFAEELAALGNPERITVRINSRGGGVFAGQAINSLLASHPAHITVIIDGLAASIASIVAMAGDEIEMQPGAMQMLHNPLMLTAGEADDLRADADVLDKIKASLVEVYVARTGKDAAAISDMLDATTWMTASEAVEQGFADRVGSGPAVEASFRQAGQILCMAGMALTAFLFLAVTLVPALISGAGLNETATC